MGPERRPANVFIQVIRKPNCVKTKIKPIKIIFSQLLKNPLMSSNRRKKNISSNCMGILMELLTIKLFKSNTN
jgi:hypothetical protein